MIKWIFFNISTVHFVIFHGILIGKIDLLLWQCRIDLWPSDINFLSSHVLQKVIDTIRDNFDELGDRQTCPEINISGIQFEQLCLKQGVTN